MFKGCLQMYEIIVIGAGPARASAALFTAKAGKKTILIDNDKGMTKRVDFRIIMASQKSVT